MVSTPLACSVIAPNRSAHPQPLGSPTHVLVARATPKSTTCLVPQRCTYTHDAHGVRGWGGHEAAQPPRTGNPGGILGVVPSRLPTAPPGLAAPWRTPPGTAFPRLGRRCPGLGRRDALPAGA